MKICNFGISLNLLRKEDIEFLNQKLHPIEPETMADLPEFLPGEFTNEWFENINYNSENYYLIEYQKNSIGLLFNKNMDWNTRTCETELFFWENPLPGNSQLLAGWLTILEFLFYYLEWNIVSTRISKTSKKSVEIIESIGFTISSRENNKILQSFSLIREQFDLDASKARLDVKFSIEDESAEGNLLLEPLDYESGIAQKIENHFLNTGIYLHRRGISGSRKYFR